MKDKKLIKSMRSLFVRRYVMALVIIATLVTCAFLSLQMVIIGQEKVAAIVNVSGKQRMLSQRITLTAFDYVSATRTIERNNAKLNLSNLIDQFEFAHYGLVFGDKSMSLPSRMSKAVRSLYFDDAVNGLDALVKRFVVTARALLFLPVGELSTNHANFIALKKEASGDLLSSLDRAVKQYQLDGEEQVSFLHRMEIFIWLMTLLTLALEAAYIFRPLTKQISKTLKTLIKAKTELAEANIRIEEANRVKGEFLNMMGHELKTPLNAIIGFADIMHLSDYTDQETVKEYSGNISEAGKKLLGIFNTILELIDVGRGDLNLEIEKLNATEIIREVADVMHFKAATKLIALNLDLDDQSHLIEGDRQRLSQAIGNILDNAIKFSDEGTSVTLSLKEINGQIIILVSDRGRGMTGEEIQFALQPLRQLDGSLEKTEYGLGVGLTLARIFIELHGGELLIDSSPGRGTTVSMIIPAAAAESAAA